MKRRTLLALAGAATVPVAVAGSAAARPIVTPWHHLRTRAARLRSRPVPAGVPSRRELDQRLTEVTGLLADLVDTAADAHTTGEPS